MVTDGDCEMRWGSAPQIFWQFVVALTHSTMVKYSRGLCQISGHRNEVSEALPRPLILCRLHLCDQ